jgi:CRISPR/Cas system-associated endonuclease Cas3-HD
MSTYIQKAYNPIDEQMEEKVKKIVEVAISHFDQFEPETHDEQVSYAVAISTVEMKLNKWFLELVQKEREEALDDFIKWLKEYEVVSTALEHLPQYLSQTKGGKGE